jgi:hypothetical protein
MIGTLHPIPYHYSSLLGDKCTIYVPPLARALQALQALITAVLNDNDHPMLPLPYPRLSTESYAEMYGEGEEKSFLSIDFSILLN